jgi:DNA-binding transcriptional LysR family regulator
MHDAHDVDPLAALARIDLNLLTVFRAVDETRHVTRAARRLGLTQPALSHALRRLRDVFDDPLFVKSPGAMVLTPLAEAVAPHIRDALARLDRDVFGRGAFKPEDLTRTFRVRSTDYVEGLLVPKLLAVLAQHAPGVRLSVLPVGIALPKADLAAGDCDLAIAGFFAELPDGFFQQKLFTDGFACAVRKPHPRIRGKLTLDDFCRERHLLVSPGGELSGTVDRALAREKRTRAIVAGASGFMVAGWIASQTELVVTAPSRLLKVHARDLPLNVLEPPLSLPDIRVAQVWHARNHEDAAHRWFREQVRAVLA